MLRWVLPLLLVSGVAAVALAQTPPPVASAPAASPYSATVPVAGTSDAQRAAAIGAALTQVLQQVAPGFSATPAQLAQASGYVRDFHYQRAPSGAGLQLQVDFDAGAVGRLVAQGGAAPASSAVAGAATPAAAGSSAVPATASTSAPGAVTSGTATVWVAGIHTSREFGSLLSTLRGDADLHDVVPIAAKGDGVLVQMNYSAPLATVLAALESPTGHLMADVQPHPGADASVHWVP